MTESDALPFRILREVYRHPSLRVGGRESYAQLASSLGVDDNTVRASLERMRKSGFLKAWSASLNPHVLGMECKSILIRLDEASLKQKKLSELRLVEGVVLIMSFLDDAGFRIVLYCKDEKDFEAKIKLVSLICGVQEPSAVWDVPFPLCNFDLKRTDWRMLGLFFRNSRMSVNEIASAPAISTRTVRRRLDFMNEGNVFFPNPIVDVGKVDGFVYFFLVSYHDKKTKLVTDPRLRGEIERIIFLDANAEFYIVTAAVCKNISEAGKISGWLGAQDGVEEVFARVVEDIIPVSDWIENEIARRTMI